VEIRDRIITNVEIRDRIVLQVTTNTMSLLKSDSAGKILGGVIGGLLFGVGFGAFLQTPTVDGLRTWGWFAGAGGLTFGIGVCFDLGKGWKMRLTLLGAKAIL
jgi:hypothetical protein